MPRFGNLRFGVLLLALAIAGFLWGVAHGSSSIERPFDLRVETAGIEDRFVVTKLSTDAVNVRIRGSRAALRNLDPSELFYPVDLKGAKRGRAEYEVENSRIEEQLPRGTTLLSRSPSRIQVDLELKGRKAVGVRADIEGEPAEGYVVAGVVVEPRRVWLAGARSQVLRLTEVVTEPIDVADMTESTEREARLFLGSGTIWREDKEPVTVRIRIEPDPEANQGEAGEAAAPQETG